MIILWNLSVSLSINRLIVEALVIREEAGCFAFLLSVACALPVIACLLFLMVPLVGNGL